MSFQQIRSFIETKVQAAFAVSTQRAPVMFDNTFETPPAVPYVICLISFPTTTEEVICRSESMIENIRGNLQLSCYAERAQGMGELENMAATAMTVMNRMYEFGDPVSVKCGQIQGPTSILASDEPYALVTLSCPFVACVN